MNTSEIEVAAKELAESAAAPKPLTISAILTELKLEPDSASLRRSVAKALNASGFISTPRRVDGEMMRVYVKKDAEPVQP